MQAANMPVFPSLSTMSFSFRRISMPHHSAIPSVITPALPTPARAELAHAITLVAVAANAVERAQQPLDRLAIINGRSKLHEAEELQEEIARLREQEAATIAFAELDETVVHIRTIEARLRSLIEALRQVGWNPGDDIAALSAAARIEKRIADGRRRPAVPADTESGRHLLELLKTDPAAALCRC
jgi:hypothetical protein